MRQLQLEAGILKMDSFISLYRWFFAYYNFSNYDFLINSTRKILL